MVSVKRGIIRLTEVNTVLGVLLRDVFVRFHLVLDLANLLQHSDGVVALLTLVRIMIDI